MAEQRDKLPIPRLPTRPKPPKKPKLIDETKAAAIEQKKEAKKQSKKARDKTRIYIGEALQRWNELKERKGLKTNAEVAFLLLDFFERDLLHSTPAKPSRKRPAPPSSQSSVSRSEREDDDDDDDEMAGMPGLEPIPVPEPASRLQDIREENIPDVQLEESLDPLQDPLPLLEASMCSLDLNVALPIDVEEFNSLHNATIVIEDDNDLSWDPEKDFEPVSASEEDETIEFNSDDDDSDEDYCPRFSMRAGGALKVSIDHLPVIGIGQSIHDEGPQTEEPSTETDAEHDVQAGSTILDDRASITYHMSLLQLVEFLRLPFEQCKHCGKPKPFPATVKSRGTAAVIEWRCQSAEKHLVWKWTSQPFLNYGMTAGDFLMSCNVLVSGNNYNKVALLFRFMNMGMVNHTTFYKIQDQYCVDTITDFWNEKRKAIISRLAMKDNVVLLGDGRMDSPGHCAQFCSYSTLENDTKQIINVVNLDKRQTGRNSVIMEREAFIQTFDQLHAELNLSEVCTDAHPQIGALFKSGKYKDSGVIHSFDIWHGAKNLGKKIHAAAQLKNCSILNQWNTDICTHFWYCCETADDYDTFFGKWTGLLHHVLNKHKWIFNEGKCEHVVPLPEGQRDKPWMEENSVAHQELTKIVLNQRWLKTVHHYLTFRSTAELESFHNHILMYASKRFSFSPPVYGARVLLAALDYNHHLGRAAKIKADGSVSHAKQFSKKRKDYRLVIRKEAKDYTYIRDLRNNLLQRRLSGEGMASKSIKRPDDARQLGVLSGIEGPTIAELLRRREEREQRRSTV